MERLTALLELLQGYDSSADDALNALLEKTAGTALGPALQRMKKPIGQYDFDSAMELLKPIMEKYSEAGEAESDA